MDRIDSLDLIRGVAVLGILAINIAGFAAPGIATLSPHLPLPGTPADEYAFAVKFVLFEGKMRALFSLLFGASLVLLIDRADAAGKPGDLLQMRRLGWLALIGLSHFYLLWWGDILFIYAVAGILALLMSEMRSRTLLLTALAIFAIWHGIGAATSYPDVTREDRVISASASTQEAQEYQHYRKMVKANADAEIRDLGGDFLTQVQSRTRGKTFQPVWTALTSMGETLPLLLLGMALLRSGFFSGTWRNRHLWLVAGAGIAPGLALTLGLLDYAWTRGFAPRTMEVIYLYWAAVPHLLMAVGYAALLVLAAPHFTRMALGKWLAASGRMAFSNYIGTTVLMTAIFYGWGLGWIGRFGHLWQWPFVFLGWALMLVWSTIWLRTFRRGPLEWAWRSLVEWRVLPNR